MAPFQFIVVATLIIVALLLATLVAFASVVVSRIRHTNAALRRIEEVLISKVGILAAVPAQTTSTTSLPPEITLNESASARYLTIRDLKKRHAQDRAQRPAKPGKRSASPVPESHAQAQRSVELNFAQMRFGKRDETDARSELPAAPAEEVAAVDPVAENPTGEVELSIGRSAREAPASHTENAIVAASLVRHGPNVAAEQATRSAVGSSASDNSVDKKERDAQLFTLNNQRRRRRERTAY